MRACTRQLASNGQFKCRNCAAKPILRRHIRSLRAVAKSGIGPAVRDSSLLDFTLWVIQTGAIKFAGVRPDVVNGVRGIYATFPVGPQVTVVAVSTQVSLTLKPGESSPSQGLVPSAVWQQLPWFAQLALKLIHERRQGVLSLLQPYIQVLPENVDLPATWDDEELPLLHYPYLMKKILEERKQWLSMYNMLPTGSQKPPWPLFIWALSCVRSRSFAGPHFGTPATRKVLLALILGTVALLQYLGIGGPAIEVLPFPAAATAIAAVLLPAAWFYTDYNKAETAVQYAMCPFLDMINHDSRVQAECGYDPLSDCFRVVTDRAVAAGQQLCINYGSQSNDQLLQVYGFAEEGNPFDRYVMLSFLEMLQLGPLQSVVTPEVFSKLDLDSGVFEEVVITAGGFPAKTTQAVSLLARQLSPPPSTNAVLAQVCEEELRCLPTSWDEDKGVLTNLLARMERTRNPPPPPLPQPTSDYASVASGPPATPAVAATEDSSSSGSSTTSSSSSIMSGDGAASAAAPRPDMHMSDAAVPDNFAVAESSSFTSPLQSDQGLAPLRQAVPAKAAASTAGAPGSKDSVVGDTQLEQLEGTEAVNTFSSQDEDEEDEPLTAEEMRTGERWATILRFRMGKKLLLATVAARLHGPPARLNASAPALT